MANEKMGLLGRKLGMTQIFSENGEVIPCTVIEAGPNTVLRVKSEDGKDGYNAIQLGFGSQKPQRVNKALMGQFAKAGATTPSRVVREVRLSKEAAAAFEVGATIGAADVFEVGQKADATGVSKGRGFAGVMKRHNMAGFIRSHGTHEFFRHGGSIGTRLTPGMVFKGKKMPGHMGAEQVTVQNLQVARVDADRNLVFVRGGVPGPVGASVLLRIAVKG